MSAHAAEPIFERANITARNAEETRVTGPIPWRRWTRDGEVLAFVVAIPRPVRLWNYQGRHRRPE